MNVQSLVGVSIKPVASVWITANAGSGKTTYLTRRVVTLLLLGVTPERICCITYTKAAASEMRHRVLSQLRQLLLMDEAACRAKIETWLNRAATAEDVARARSLFGLVLDSPSGGLQLTTIHGFCQTILRRFPLEAGINPHFTVLEDGAADRLIAAEKNRLLNHYKGDYPELNAALSLIAERTSESRFEDYIDAIVVRRGQWESIWRGQSSESLRAHLFALNGVPENASEQMLIDTFATCITDAQAAAIRAALPDLQNHSKAAEQNMGRVLAAWLECAADQRSSLIDAFCDLFLTKSEGTIRKTLLNKKEYPDGHPLREAVESIAQCAWRFQQSLAALASAEESYAMAVLARTLLEQYARAKEQQHALDYDDLIGKTRELFANPALLGWVMTKLDHRIDHLLVDEAQDTSGEQWSITDLLVEELIAASDGVGSGNVPRSLLVVGDEKQSIYSFQGAAPELFASTRSAFEAKLSPSYAPLNREALASSYRSAAPVLALVDEVAKLPGMAAALSAEGQIEPHVLTRDTAAGSVTLYPPVIAPEPAPATPLTMPMEYTLTQSAARQLADTIAATIEDWLHSGRPLVNLGRPIEAGDILILVRSRTSIVLPLIRTLERRNIPVAGMDRLTLSKHLAVRDLLALMAFVLNPADDLALAQVLRSPIIGISEDALRALCFGRSGTLFAALGNHPLILQALECRHATPYDFLSEILEVQGRRSLFATRFGEEVHEILDELKSQAAALPEGMAPTLANFYDWLSGSERQIKREQETGSTDRVRIMTVHGAKGLEAPVVVLADTVSMPTTQKEIFFFAKTPAGQLLPALALSEEAKRAPVLVAAKQSKADSLMAEYYRLLYVALTRARDELHVWGTATKKGTISDRTWYRQIEQAMHNLGAVQDGELLHLSQEASEAIAGKPRAFAASQPLPDWATRAAPRASATVQASTPSSLAPDEMVSAYAASGGAGQRARGVRIHRILELIHADSDDTTVTKLSHLIAPEWEENERTQITRQLSALLEQERWIWQSPSHAEVNIGGTIDIHGTPVSINGQIDRLIETPEAMVILDYKTGHHVPASPDAISENYRVQLKTYHALVSRLYPEKTVRCALLWTGVPLLMWCDEAIAATAWKAPATLTAA